MMAKSMAARPRTRLKNFANPKDEESEFYWRLGLKFNFIIS